jgi:hypothetical protein
MDAGFSGAARRIRGIRENGRFFVSLFVNLVAYPWGAGEQDGGAVGVVLDAQACAVRAVFFTQPVGGVIGEAVGSAVFVDQVGEPASFVVVNVG